MRPRAGGLVGLVMPELDNPFFPRLAHHLEISLARMGLSPVLCSQTLGGVHEDDYVAILLEHSVTGIVFVSGVHALVEQHRLDRAAPPGQGVGQAFDGEVRLQRLRPQGGQKAVRVLRRRRHQIHGPEPARIDQLISGIQRQLETTGDEVTAAQIGEAVMQGLKGLDHVAYIRFASVYKDFTEPGDFAEIAEAVGEIEGES